jgi:hypothetical protein
MVQTGAEKGCCGNFALGIPGLATDPSLQCFVDCCRPCPPDCCDTLYFYFYCGEPSESDPCCGETSFFQTFPLGEEDTEYYFSGEQLDELPSFLKDFESEAILRKLEDPPAVGSCPCEEIQITLTTTNCCFVLGGDASAVHVGDGWVEVSISPSSGVCGNYIAEVSVNGGAWTSGLAQAEDNDTVSVRLRNSGNEDCPDCECCFTRSEDPCNYGSEMFFLQKTSTGAKLVVNQEAIIRRHYTLQNPQIIQLMRARENTDPRKVRAVKRIAPVKTIKRVPIF